MSIALNVITGFLGSGKTTLLKRLLQGESLGDTALLINEFGDVGIDHLLVEEVAPDTVLLASEPGGNLFVGQTLGPNSGDVMHE